jgi:hypothetical protein
MISGSYARSVPNRRIANKGDLGHADEGGVLDGSFREATRSQALRLRYR